MAEQFVGYVEAYTEKSILFQDHYWHRSDWLPRSQIDIFRQADTSEVVISATAWICGKKGIREFTEVLPDGE